MTDVRVVMLTDVVDSTALNQRMGDRAMATVWARHDAAARELLRAWGGREVGRSDGFLLLFDRAPDAVGFALAYHRVLRDLSIVARVGIHAGPLALRENSSADRALGATPFEVDGIALPVAARVSALAGGGQTLVTEPVRLQLTEGPAEVRDFGFWRFKGISEPMRVFGIGEPGAAQGLAPPVEAPKAYRVTRVGDDWLPARQVPNNLARERDRFVGRTVLLNALVEQLDAEARLITLLGTGGVGKTRAALHFANQHLGDFASGAWFCDLSQASSVDGILNAVAQALDVPLGAGDPVDKLGTAIAGRGRCLIVLDNFEQVTRYARPTLDRWLATTRDAVFLVTSREVLGLAGERVVSVAPLDPEEAKELFRERAAAAGGHQHLLAGDDDLATLVDRLDRLPLALELAAARSTLLTPAQMLARLNERFRLLAAAGVRHDRQATLRATLDWSWDLLDEGERVALAHLSVFEGGFTLAAAETVLDLGGTGSDWALDVLHSLQRKSLVRSGQGERLALLRSVQEYAAERLLSLMPDAAARQAAWRRHWRFFASIPEADATAERCADTDNLVAACLRAAGEDPDHAVELLVRAWAALHRVGPFRAVLPLVAAIESAAPCTPSQHCRIDGVAGRAHMLMGHLDPARERLSSCLQLARATGDVEMDVLARGRLASMDIANGDVATARDRIDAALSLARADGHGRALMHALNDAGSLQVELGQTDQAHAAYTEALALARQLADRRFEGGLHGNLGTLEHSRGRLAQARAHYQSGLAIASEIGDRQWEGNTRSNLGLLLHEMGEHQAALAELDSALALARAIGHLRLEATALCNLGLAHEALGHQAPAAERYASAVSSARALANKRMEAQFRGYLGLCLARQGQASAAQEELDWVVAQSSLADDPLSLGLVHCQRAIAASLRHDTAGCRQEVARAEALLRPLGLGDDAEAMRLLSAARDELSSRS